MGAAADFCGGDPGGLQVRAQLSGLKRLVAGARMWCLGRNLTAEEIKMGQTERTLARSWRLRASPWWRARCDQAADDTPILKERSQWRSP